MGKATGENDVSLGQVKDTTGDTHSEQMMEEEIIFMPIKNGDGEDTMQLGVEEEEKTSWGLKLEFEVEV